MTMTKEQILRKIQKGKEMNNLISQFFEKSIQVLELPRVLAMLADEAVTEEGKEIVADCEGGFISVQKDNTRIIATKFDIIE